MSMILYAQKDLIENLEKSFDTQRQKFDENVMVSLE